MASRRHTLVRAALLVAVTTSLGLLAAGREPPASAQRAEPPGDTATERSPAVADPEALRFELPLRSAQEGTPRDLFAAHTWQRPPPPPPPEPPKLEPAPPPPVAPPAPFTVLGTFEAADGKTVFYLAEGDHLHTASQGDVPNGVWRVEKATVDGLVLLYLPLSLPQTLGFGTPK